MNKKSVSDLDTETEHTSVNTEPETAAVPPAETVPEETKPPESKERYEGITNFVYIGPSLPGGRLKSDTVLNGTYAEITEYYKDAIALYPDAARLIVPVARLAESREKIQRGGNVLHKYYAELAANTNQRITPEINKKGDEE